LSPVAPFLLFNRDENCGKQFLAVIAVMMMSGGH